MKTNTTFNNEGKAMTETAEGIEMPADYSFATVNDYVHQVGRTYEELEALCLGMACAIDSLSKTLLDLNYPPADARWYCVSRCGQAALCLDRATAEARAKAFNNNRVAGGPFKAVKLMEVVEAEPTI